MRISVDGRGYADAVHELRTGGDLAASCYEALVRELAGSAGMAGSDATSREFARTYDAAAGGAVDALADVVGAFASVARLGQQSLANHEVADTGTARASAVLGPAVPCAVVPSAGGANEVRLPPLWDHLRDHLQGWAWPDADTARLRSAASSWQAACESLRALDGPLRIAQAAWEVQRSPEIPSALAALTNLQAAVGSLADDLAAIATACETYAADVERHRAVVEEILHELAVQAGISIVAGAVVGLVTFGAGTAAGEAVATWRIVAAAQRVIATLRALRDLAEATVLTRLIDVTDRLPTLRRTLQRFKDARAIRTAESARAARALARPEVPGEPLPSSWRPPTAGANWEGRIADSGKGEVWQLPGASRDSHSVRIMDPTERYPNGYVVFTDARNQPLNLGGDPGTRGEAHIPISKDGSYPIPKGWQP